MEQIKTYKNGMRLVVDSKKDLGIIAFAIRVNNVGSAFEKQPKEAGISHFVEHMIYNSTKKHSSKQIEDLMAHYGIVKDADSGMFGTRFYFKVIKEHFEKVLKLYSEMIFEPAFIPSNIEREKEVIYEEINRANDHPSRTLSEIIDENMYSNSFMNNKNLGTKETIEKFDAEMLREFKEKHYKPENMVFSVAGDITFDEAEKLINKHFASKYESENEPKTINEIVEPNIKDKHIIVNKDTANSIIVIRINLPRVDDDNYPATRFYHSILGCGPNSRLFYRLRKEKGLCL